MTETDFFLIAGTLLVFIALTSPILKPLPLSLSNLYIGVGVLLGPVFGLVSHDELLRSSLFRYLSEIAVLVSLFTVGLNVRFRITNPMWTLPLRLLSVSMLLTIGLVTLVGTQLLGLPLGAAVLLGAMLAPTDPVLASDVQVEGVTDQDALRFSLTGEAGLNDGAAFPFVLLGMGLLGIHPNRMPAFLHQPSQSGFALPSWLLWDLVWPVIVGIALGWITGWLVGKFVLLLRERHVEISRRPEFLVLGLITLAYGVAELAGAYGFLSVFAAGYALRYLELQTSGYAPEPPELTATAPGDVTAAREAAAAEPRQAAHLLTVALLGFNDQLEHILAAAVVVFVGAVLAVEYWSLDLLLLAPLLFLVIRPFSVFAGMALSNTNRVQRGLIGWFGIRGIASIYYLTYAIEHGLSGPVAERMTGLVLAMVVVSIVIHGTSVTPLMSWYKRVSDKPA